MMSSKSLEIASEEDAQILLTKLAAMLQKMHKIASLPPEQQATTAAEVERIYIPIAHRLGLYAIKSALEDLHLKLAAPAAYQALRSQLKDTKAAKKRFVQRFTSPLQEVLQSQGFDFRIQSRIKSIASIRKKMERTGLALDQVYDVFAVRIVLDVPLSQEQLTCWEIYKIVIKLYTAHPTKFRDWLSLPRPNGYQSLHVTVMNQEKKWVEVQIRTKKNG